MTQASRSRYASAACHAARCACVTACRTSSLPSACSRLTLFGAEKTRSYPATGASALRSERRSPVCGSIRSTATNRFGAVLENVVFDPKTRIPDFDDDSKTENTRSAYPLEFMPRASRTGRGGHPKNIIFLTADAFGVMPPIAKLTPAQAMYHFLSGYTAKVAGTEKGLVGVQPEFSTCFAAPFLPRKLRPSPDDERGRGLQLVAMLADRWGTRPTPAGKAVWCMFAS